MKEDEINNSAFSLVKYYFDCVSENGDTLIGYSARLKWRIFNIDYAGALFYDAALERRYEINHFGKSNYSPFNFSIIPVSLSSRSVMHALDSQFRENTVENGVDFFDNDSLNIKVKSHKLPSKIQQQLYESEEGKLAWTCYNQNEKLKISGRFNIEGIGYSERIQMTIKPWDLPIDKIKWGRFASVKNSLVWIIWEGSEPKVLAWLNGVQIDSFNIDLNNGQNSNGSIKLKIDDKKSIRDGKILKILNSAPEWLLNLGGNLANAHESKFIANSILTINDEDERGWTIFEEVTWK